jgi:probable F420-dependent oxidoreductase
VIETAASGAGSPSPALTIDVAFHGDPRSIASAAASIEQCGAVGGLFVAEARHDPFVSLAVAATATTKLQLGTSVAIAFARTPMSMAYPAYDLHRVAGGRTILGLGSQIEPHIRYRYGMPWSRPAVRMAEYVSALRAIWHAWQTGSKLDFRGDFYTHTLMPPLFNPGPLDDTPPIWLAGVGRRMIGTAGSVADGLLCHPLISQSYLRDVVTPQVLAARSAGPRAALPFTLATMAMVATGRTAESMASAAAGTRRQIGFYASTPAYKPVLDHHGWGDLHHEAHAMSKSGRWAQLADLVDDDVLHTFAVVGSIDEVGRRLRERFAGLAERVTLSIPYDADDRLGPDIAAAVSATEQRRT